jgi:hypothetical protein
VGPAPLLELVLPEPPELPPELEPLLELPPPDELPELLPGLLPELPPELLPEVLTLDPPSALPPEDEPPVTDQEPAPSAELQACERSMHAPVAPTPTTTPRARYQRCMQSMSGRIDEQLAFPAAFGGFAARIQPRSAE